MVINFVAIDMDSCSAYLTYVEFWFYKNVFEKMEKGARQSTRRVLPWHGYGSEYLQGTAEGMEMVMCD
jgi:hypothetical protein